MNAPKSSILLVYTGGTIGMKEDPCDGTLRPFNFDSLLEEVPELGKFACRIDSCTFSPLIDSSDVEPSMWQDLARLIRDRYEDYDGFVILHGTDTMAYSASALSFMLDNLDKPVIFTGSQLPIGRPRTDGKENLISSVEIAAAKREDGSAMVPEVCIFFNSQLFRGNRCTKTDAGGFDAFSSPNYPPLASAGINIRYNTRHIQYPAEHWACNKYGTGHFGKHTQAASGYHAADRALHTLRQRYQGDHNRDLRIRQCNIPRVVHRHSARGLRDGAYPIEYHAVSGRGSEYGPVRYGAFPQGSGSHFGLRFHDRKRARKTVPSAWHLCRQREGKSVAGTQPEGRNLKIMLVV